MCSGITLTVELFGALKQYTSEGHIDVCASENDTAHDVKMAIRQILEYQCGRSIPLVDACVLADEKNILPADFRFQNPMTLAILPPVCGG